MGNSFRIGKWKIIRLEILLGEGRKQNDEKVGGRGDRRGRRKGLRAMCQHH